MFWNVSSTRAGSVAYSACIESIVKRSSTLQPGTTRNILEVKQVGLTCCSEGECTAWDHGPSQEKDAREELQDLGLC